MDQCPEIIVVGAGISGMTASLYLVERGLAVSLVSSSRIGMATAATGESGINAVCSTRRGDDPERHFADTMQSGEGLAHPDFVKEMCQGAEGVVNVMERIGVVFDKTREGAFRVGFAAASSFPRQLQGSVPVAQQVSRCLAEQVLHLQSEQKIKLYEGWEFLSAVLDHEGIYRGLVVQNKQTMEIVSLKSDAVVMATGDMSALYGKASLKGPQHMGYPIFQLYNQGAYLANPEFSQFYPYALTLFDKSLGIPSTLLTDRVSLPFAKEIFSEPLNRIHPTQVTRAMAQFLAKISADEKNPLILSLKVDEMARLDGHHHFFKTIAAHGLWHQGQQSLKVEPALQTTLGGLWTGPDHMTNLRGVFAIGDCASYDHGAGILPGNHVLSLWISGESVAEHLKRYVQGMKKTDEPRDFFATEVRLQQERQADFMEWSGPENVHQLYDELTTLTGKALGWIRFNPKIDVMISEINELKARFKKVAILDKGMCLNEELFFVQHFEGMLELAAIMAKAALCRNETRGGHYKPDYPDRDDENYMKTTKVKKGSHGPMISYEDVVTTPRPWMMAG